MHVVDLDPGDPRLETDRLSVLRELRAHLTAETFSSVYAEGRGILTGASSSMEWSSSPSTADQRTIPPTLTLGRRHSLNETVMSPEATSSRSSGLNSMVRTAFPGMSGTLSRAPDARAEVQLVDHELDNLLCPVALESSLDPQAALHAHAAARRAGHDEIPAPGAAVNVADATIRT